jgi:hypothetical protein
MLIEHWRNTDDYRVSALLAGKQRVIAVAWSHYNKATKQKTWNVYNTVHGGGPVATGLTRRQARECLRKEVSKH